MAEKAPDRTDNLAQPEVTMLDSTVASFDDSESDISMSDGTEDDEAEAPPIISSAGSKKRRHTDEEESNGHNGEISLKRLKLKADPALVSQYTSNGHLHEDKSLLPAEIWHNIFTFTPPRMLGSLLQVNKLFNSYLDPSSTVNKPAIERLSTSVATFLDPDSIWQASRVLFRPGMPTPLAGFSELDMWKLACRKSCQFCHTKGRLEPVARDQWHEGPGDKGVKVVWSFAIRSCASCLMKNCVKEIDLLLSPSDPALVIPALPFIFITNDSHIVSHAALQNGFPPNVQFAKYFFKPHVEDMKVEFFKAKEMGTAAAEEWIKGLDDLGKDRRNDAVRWERWEALGGVRRMHGSGPNEKVAPVLPSKPQWASYPIMSSIIGINPVQQNGRPSSAGKILQALPQAIQAPQPIAAPFSNLNVLPRFTSPAGTNGFGNAPRNARTKEEAAEMKAARRAEIERRAILLDPPLTAAVLAHMSSFQAALQIIKPLDDNAWELLKPRLLSQRAEAEQREKDRVLQTRVLQEVVDERRHLPHDQQTKEAEKEWDDVQAPLRARIAGFADEIIRDGWANGSKVTNENSPQFAAEVLVYVRKRFYAEVAKDDAAARAAGQQPKVDPPHGPYTQKLILENMKWVFDSKIKPHTEQYRKEIFLCNGCDNYTKSYGFEGVIQHYAAKHTSSLSVGSIVVHWKAEWPEFPPFHPDPTSQSRASSHALPSSYALPTSASYGNAGPPTHSNNGWNGYPQASASIPAPSINPYQPNPNPPYGQKKFGEPYAGTQNGFQAPSQGPQGSKYPGNGQAYQPYHPLPLPPSKAPADPRAPLYHGGNTFQQPLPNLASQQSPGYAAQLEFVASTAREIWNSTTGVKEMPGSVRVYVIIHQVINRSRGQFPSEPPLAMFIDGLHNNKEMRPVRNINGLSCKTCNSDPSRAVPGERKSFSLPQLFNHFQAHHNASQDLYWVNDMVQLPEMSKISALLYTPGMDDYKLKLIADIFPLAFPKPLPRVEAARAAVAQSESYHRNPKFGDRSKNNKGRRGNHALSKQNGYETEQAATGLMPVDGLATNYGNFSQKSHNDRNENKFSPRIKNGDGWVAYNLENGQLYEEMTTPVDRHANDMGDAAYDPRSVNHYAQNQRADETLTYPPASSSRPPTATMSSEDGVSRRHSKQSRNRQSSLLTTERVDLPPGEVEKLSREAEEQERLKEEALRESWKAERIDSMRRMFQPASERQGDDFDVEGEASGAMRRSSLERPPNTRAPQKVRERRPSQARPELAYEYEEGQTYAAQGPQYSRERSPELVDHRYKRNNVIYRDERQASHGSGRGMAPSRYARYESVRLENDRARSRSPVYVKVGAQPGQYRERSPVPQQLQPEAAYRGQTPPEQVAYERAPRTEYYYAEEPRALQPAPEHIEPYEYVRVADPAGDYMIRRPLPMRREPVYAQYEDDGYARPPAYETREPLYEAREPLTEVREPVYETRAPVSRSDPAYYEEYDPRNPAPPPVPTVRQPRYQ